MKEMWLTLLDKHRAEFDMSSVDLDGSHTTALRGGEECGYQGRKKRKSTNSLYLTDRQELPTEHLRTVRNQFVLMCWTGARHSDLE